MRTDPKGFFDVDTQLDFMMPYGKLYVKGADQILPNIGKLYKYAVENKIPVIATVDAHTEEDPEFKLFPPHCIKGTPGQRKVPESTLKSNLVIGLGEDMPLFGPERPQQIIIEKRTFDIFDNPNTERLLQMLGLKEWIVFGVATDYCVKAAALGLLKRGYSTLVVSDAIKGVREDTTRSALQELRLAGAHFVNTTKVIG
jgi:nicotinamidase/pyrazinamidase